MNAITTEYLNRAELWLLITMLAYFLMNGAQVFETAVLVPKWTKDPPASLSVLRGPYAPDLKTFWVAAHSVHELTFMAAIGFSWQLTAIRYALLTIFALHFLVRIWTLGYFAPKIMAFQLEGTDTTFPNIQATVKRWRNLNYIRVAAFVALSVWVVLVYGEARHLRSTNILTNKRQLMEQRLSVITLGVDNLAAQKEFYKSKIGWEPVAENKDIIFFKMNGFLFSLFGRKELAEGSGVPAEGTGFRSLTISHNVAQKEQVDELYREYKAKGITITKEPTPTPFGGYYFVFTDPEHNVLEVAYNPYIPLDEVGNVVTHKSIDDL